MPSSRGSSGRAFIRHAVEHAAAQLDFAEIKEARRREALAARLRLLALCHPAELQPPDAAGLEAVYIPCVSRFFKVVAVDKAGGLVSVFDGLTSYRLHKWTYARAGAASFPPTYACFYAFLDPLEAIAEKFPANSNMLKAPKMLVKLEATGAAYFRKSDGAWLLSQVRVIDMVTQLSDDSTLLDVHYACNPPGSKPTAAVQTHARTAAPTTPRQPRRSSSSNGVDGPFPSGPLPFQPRSSLSPAGGAPSASPRRLNTAYPSNTKAGTTPWPDGTYISGATAGKSPRFDRTYGCEAWSPPLRAHQLMQRPGPSSPRLRAPSPPRAPYNPAAGASPPRRQAARLQQAPPETDGLLPCHLGTLRTALSREGLLQPLEEAGAGGTGGYGWQERGVDAAHSRYTAAAERVDQALTQPPPPPPEWAVHTPS